MATAITKGMAIGNLKAAKPIQFEVRGAETKPNFSYAIIVLNNMFCARCGKAEQLLETYCRQCGLFLADPSNPIKREIPLEEYLKANTVLNSLTISLNFTLSILLLLFFGFRPGAHPLIYVMAGLLILIGGWHIQNLIVTQQLKKQWRRRAPPTEIQSALPETEPALKSTSTAKLLDQADFKNKIPASVTENTTRHLAE